MTERTFRPRLLTTAMASHSLVGCLCLWPAITVITSNAPAATNSSAPVFVFSPELCRLIATQLMGLAAGLICVRAMLDKFVLKTVWGVGLAIAGSGLAMTALAPGDSISWLPSAAFAVLGAGAALLWQTGQEAVMATTPNFRRWHAMGWMTTAFCAACLVMTFTLVVDQLLPADFPLRGPTGLLIMATGLIGLSVALNYQTTAANALPDENSTTLNAAAAAACCDYDDHDHDHDHDHDPQHTPGSVDSLAEASCDVEQCCGDTKSCQSSLWIGVTLAACGWTLLLSTVNQLVLIVCQPVTNTSQFSGLLPLAGVGLGIMLCVTAYRRLMQQMGNTLALPLFLSINLLLAVTCFISVSITGCGMVTQLFAAVFCGASSACLHGCFSQVPEYFWDTQQQKRRTNALAAAAAVAAITLLVCSLVPHNFRITALLLVMPALSTITTILAMRCIRQPILVTRFAERFLAQKI